ncbi:hypothetical protein ANO14919_066430 [Xylariales sp. No.14919]|nr:hypothetical protein ANO14919_066430 [Xylariales sp. No.14919]
MANASSFVFLLRCPTFEHPLRIRYTKSHLSEPEFTHSLEVFSFYPWLMNPQCCNPIRPLLHLAHRQQQFDRVEPARKILVVHKAMHKAVAGPTEPRRVPQVARAVPSATDRLGVCRAGDKMVVREADPVAAVDLADVGAACARCWRGCEDWR